MGTELPRKIWIYWEQGWTDAPLLVRECAASWERLNPDYEVILLDKNMAREIVGLNSGVMMLSDQCPVQASSDLIRLAILHAQGGIWADATLYCRRPIDDWLPRSPDMDAFFFSNPDRDRLISSWFISARQGSSAMRALLDDFTAHLQSMSASRKVKIFKRFLRRVIGWRLNRSAKATLGWWHPALVRLSIWPYYLFHYCYNRLYFTDPEFRKSAMLMPIVSAKPCHALQAAGKAVERSRIASIIADGSIPVHKLNWRLVHKDPLWHEILGSLRSVTEVHGR